jgi:hypothetical protein
MGRFLPGDRSGEGLSEASCGNKSPANATAINNAIEWLARSFLVHCINWSGGRAVDCQLIYFRRSPDEFTRCMLDACDALMMGMDAAANKNEQARYAAVKEILVRVAAVIDARGG